MDLRDIIYLLTLTGPLFSISNLIGAERTRDIELWLLKSFAVILRLSKGFVYISIFAVLFLIAQIFRIAASLLLGIAAQPDVYFSIALRIGIYAIAFITTLVITVYFQSHLKWYKFRKWTIVTGILMFIGFFGLIFSPTPDYMSSNNVSLESIFFSVLIILFSVLMILSLIPFWIMSFHSDFHGSCKLTHVYLGKIAAKWRSITSTTPPWPISYGEREYDVAKSFWFLNSSPFLAVVYGFIAPVFLLLAFLAVSPFILAEKTRRRLTPEKPIFMDLLGYVVSALSIIYLAIERLYV